jgi:Flp pilus assembly pilin Flp
MKRLTSVLKNVWKDESGQGATEYILLLVIVVAVAMLFKGKILEIINGKLAELQTAISSFTAQ